MQQSTAHTSWMRSVIGVTLLRSVGYTVALLVFFYAAPLTGRTSASDVLLLTVGLLGFGILVWRGARAVMTSPTPRARAVQVIAAAVPLFVVVFAAAYCLIAEQSAHSFSASLNRTRRSAERGFIVDRPGRSQHSRACREGHFPTMRSVVTNPFGLFR